MDSSVATTTATMVAIGATAAAGSPSDRSGPLSSDEMAGSIVYPVSSVVSVMPSCALDRCVEVILSAAIVIAEARLAALPAGFEVAAVEVDERELARDEQAGAEDQQQADPEHDPLIQHGLHPVRGGAEGGSSIVRSSIPAALATGRRS